MEFIEARDQITGDAIYTLRIELNELIRTPFYPFDRVLLADCEGDVTIADRLLALELIARRIEESEAALDESRR